MKLKKTILSIGGGIVLCIIPTSISCSKNNSSFKLNEELREQFVPWYESLTNATWNKDSNGNYENYHCDSEQQAIGLYSWNGGTFWNEALHKGKTPTNVTLTLKNMDRYKPHEIRGEDYKLIDSALDKATYPEDGVLYHGVEYQEIEFYEQLKDFIVKTNNGYDYSKTIGQTIQSYGWISTTLDYEYAKDFAEDWRPSYENEWPSDIQENNPLKEKAMFIINIKKGYKGAAYLANFDFAGFGTGSQENQVLLKRNCKFKINNVKKENGINMFYVDLVDW